MLGRLDHFRPYLPPPETMAAPVTVVVVRTIAGNTTGCSLGMTADWVVCQASLFDAADPHSYDETVLVHELGHALNLPHHKDPANLMFPSSSPPEHVRGTASAALAGAGAADQSAHRPPPLTRARRVIWCGPGPLPTSPCSPNPARICGSTTPPRAR